MKISLELSGKPGQQTVDIINTIIFKFYCWIEERGMFERMLEIQVIPCSKGVACKIHFQLLVKAKEKPQKTPTRAQTELEAKEGVKKIHVVNYVHTLRMGQVPDTDGAVANIVSKLEKLA